MKQPLGYVHPNFPDYVCRLHKALYDLKQAPHAWYHRFVVFITSLGFRNSYSDCSLFIYHQGSYHIYLLLYVDDIILTASSHSLIYHVITRLSSEFPMTDLGPISFFLGIAASRTKKGMLLSQFAFARDILSHPYMLSCNPCSIPTYTNPKLSPRRTPITDPTMYRSLAGAL